MKKKRYITAERNFRENHAGSKARNDAAAILTENGYEPVYLHHSRQKGTADKLKMCLVTAADWISACFRLQNAEVLCLQYPLAMYPKVSLIAIPFLKLIRKRGTRLIYLIHDLDSLRGINETEEAAFLKEADELIAHNERMADYIRSRYAFKGKIRILGIFDYLTDEVKEKEQEQVIFPAESGANRKNVIEIAAAGNLNREKAGYLYQKKAGGAGICFLAYGPNYVEKEAGEQVCYCGVYPPEKLPAVLKGSYGLVWDGERTDCCFGSYGSYLKYNDPHKASLYLACGLPLIVWDQSAIADFVLREGAGIAVSSLEDLRELLLVPESSEYRKMKAAAVRIGKKLKQGEMLKNAVRDL